MWIFGSSRGKRCGRVEEDLSRGLESHRRRIRELERELAERELQEDADRKEVSRLAQAFLPARIRAWCWTAEERLTYYLPIRGDVRDSRGRPASQVSQTEEELLEAIHPDDREGLAAIWDRAYQEHVPYDIEYRLVLPDGKIRHNHEIARPEFDESGRYLGHFGTSQDITGRKQAEAALRKARDELEFRVEERTRDIRETNEALKLEIAERERVESALRESEQALKDRIEKLEEAQRKLERQGADLTQLAKDLESARDQAEKANRAKSEFLATMSHEIRTPMNGVLGMASALLAKKLSSQQRDQVQVIKESGEALLGLLNDILDLSKIEAGKMALEPVDFLVRDLLKVTEALWKSRSEAKGLSFTVGVDLGAGDGFRADKLRLRQVLFNLIGNAIKFTEAGAISVSVSEVEGDGTRLLFKVSDTGIGIGDDTKSKLFNPFEQADASTTRKFGGTGLGLAISKHLVELMGGEIGVDSEPGKGSTFSFTVPMEPAQSDDFAVHEKRDEAMFSAPQIGRTLKILAAEDNHVNQLVLTNVLRPIGCELDIVANGAEALAAVQAGSYDLVLMDIQMPGMDGPTATRKIRALSGNVAQVPIIALTANAMKGDREKYMAGGMTDYVSKPINAQELFGAILRCCDEMPQGGAAAAGATESPVLPESSRDEPAADDTNPNSTDREAYEKVLENIKALTRESKKIGTG